MILEDEETYPQIPLKASRPMLRPEIGGGMSKQASSAPALKVR